MNGTPTVEAFDFLGLIDIKPSVPQIKKLLTQIDFYTPLEGRTSKQHSKDIDKILGYKIPKIEQNLLKKYRPYYLQEDASNNKKKFSGTQTWIGLHPQVLQTPYSEISKFLSLLKKFNPKTIVDLGAGYGRVGIVMSTIVPNAIFIGYEILGPRIREARRMFSHLGLTNCNMQDQDILCPSFEIPKADIYFIYDFSEPEDLNIILRQLSKIKRNEQCFLIAKGNWVRKQIKRSFPEFKIYEHNMDCAEEWTIYSFLSHTS